MAEYYLIAQLPALEGCADNQPLPITEERFLELCSRLMAPKALRKLSSMTLLPSQEYERCESALLEAWNNGERNLRLALAKLRAQRMGKPVPEGESLPDGLLKTVSAALDMESPLEAERFLNRYRLQFLETLRPSDTFSEEFVYYYGLKLKLLLRSRQFDTRLGEAEYRNIYNSIMNGDRLEAI